MSNIAYNPWEYDLVDINEMTECYDVIFQHRTNKKECLMISIPFRYKNIKGFGIGLNGIITTYWTNKDNDIKDTYYWNIEVLKRITKVCNEIVNNM